MRIKIAPDDPQSMNQDGDAILRSLQNKSLPLVDLMVRESLQNSLDASLENVNTTKVKFYVNSFESERLANQLEGVTDTLEKRFSGMQKYIAISDNNTTGLNGVYYHTDQDKLNSSNFHKLVFGIGKNQTKEDAGGSWGLGKTSYFRMGIGIVIYYTRIKTSSGYEERLIASLIESPKNNERVLPASARGIAWWGTYADKDEKVITPILDEEIIEDFLNTFKLSRYQEDETGTTIIIPYVNDLYQGEDPNAKMPWESEDESILFTSVQRWYMPRIFNSEYVEEFNKSMLECSINNKVIVPKGNTEPIFEVFQDLYNAALTKKSEDQTILVKEITLGRRAMKTAKTTVGTVAFKEVSRDELKMGAPNNKNSAMEYLGFRGKEINERNNYKIMAYSRSPGMIVEYDVDGDWFPKEMIQKEDHLLCGFFVPNSSGELSNIFKDKGHQNLEGYLRSTENADHASWEDEASFTIVHRIKLYTSKAILKEYQTEESKDNQSATSALSRKFGGLLMPPTGFGKTSTRGQGSGSRRTTGNKNGKKSDIRIMNSSIKADNEVLIKVKLSLKNLQKYRLFLQVMTQERNMDSSDWANVIGDDVSFPFVIKNITVMNINSRGVANEDLIISKDFSSEVILENNVAKNLEVDIEMIIQTESESFNPGLSIRSL